MKQSEVYHLELHEVELADSAILLGKLELSLFVLARAHGCFVSQVDAHT